MGLQTLLISGGALIVGALASQLIFRRLKFFDLEKAKEKSEHILQKSKEEAIEIKNESEKNLEDIQQHADGMIKQVKTLIHTIEQNVKFKEEALERKSKRNQNSAAVIAQLEKEIKDSENKQSHNDEEIKQKLATRLGVNIEGVTEKLLADYSSELKQDSAERVAKLVNHAKEIAEKKAKNILKGAMQKFTDSTSVEKSEAKVIVKRDDVKALIVGPKAANIMAFEDQLGVDVVFNDEPKTITISSYDLLKKTVGHIAMEKLVRLRKIDTKVVKEALAYGKKKVEADLIDVGQKAIKKMGFKRKFPADLIKIIGRLKYRTSYGQNILLHSFEVAYMAELLASEMGIDAKTAKIAAFFHDIGKAIDQHIEGSHDVLTREIMTKYGCFSDAEIHAAWTHHEAETPETPEARIIMAADAISAGRPGARQESLEKYLERLRALEEIATSFHGVQKTYAISAGREIRVMVSPEEVEDGKMDGMATDIANRIEDELSYPGKIKVNVIRRTRAVDFAK